MTTRPAIPLSVLDLAPVPVGSTGAEAIRASVDLARQVERWGYRRIWFAEHHLAPGVASAAPAVLAALAAGVTSTIRVGSGAVLLGSTSPVVAAEQFGTLAAVHPGRVDLGLGRASFPPPAPETAATSASASAQAPATPRLSGDGRASAGGGAQDRTVDGLLVPAAPPFGFDDPHLRARIDAQRRFLGAGRTPGAFRDELGAVLALQADRAAGDDGRHVTSPPVAGADLSLWVLASSAGESARVAGELGLPLAANYHVSPATVLETVEAYRAAFRPGVLAEPYVVVSADVLVAESAERAAELADPFAAWVLSIRSGAGAIEYPRPGTTPAWDELSDADRALLRDRVATRFVGDAETVADGLATLARVTEADELLVTTITHDPADTLRSYALLAEAWGSGAGDSAGDSAGVADSGPADARRELVRG